MHMYGVHRGREKRREGALTCGVHACAEAWLSRFHWQEARACFCASVPSRSGRVESGRPVTAFLAQGPGLSRPKRAGTARPVYLLSKVGD